MSQRFHIDNPIYTNATGFELDDVPDSQQMVVYTKDNNLITNLGDIIVIKVGKADRSWDITYWINQLSKLKEHEICRDQKVINFLSENSTATMSFEEPVFSYLPKISDYIDINELYDTDEIENDLRKATEKIGW